jgi:hypothetical protein
MVSERHPVRAALRCAAVVVAAWALLCASAAGGATAGRSLQFRTLAYYTGSGSAATKRTFQVARDAAAWRRMWRQLNQGTVPQPRLPKVDFSRDMVILVTQGEKPTAGYGIRVTSIRENTGSLIVSADERSPGRGCVVPQVVTAPYHAVSVRRSARPVVVVRRSVVRDCPA